ncbi:hypothetical protein Tco_0462811 [Tanacetum coccineum]
MQTVAGDGVTGIKRRRRDLSSDCVRILAMTSGRGRLKEDLESSTWRRRQDHKAMPSYDIYSTVDACKTANEMWIAIERLQQGESLNVQDVKTNLFWEFGKFTSRDGESMKSYYSRHKGQRESPNQLQPQSESVSVEDSVLKQAQRDKDMAKEFGPPLLAKVFQKALQTYHTHNLEPYAKLQEQDERYHTYGIKNDNQSGSLVVNQKHDELVKRSLLTKSQFEGQLKEKSKVILDLKVKEEKDIDKMIKMDKQLKFLNEVVYTRNQSIQTIHMLAPKCLTYNDRPTFANPRYLKNAQSEKPCLYEIPYDNSDHTNRFAPDREETITLANKSRSKLNKDYVKPYDYTRHNSLYEIFKAPSLEYLYQLERAKEVRKTMWRKPFVRTKPVGSLDHSMDEITRSMAMKD